MTLLSREQILETDDRKYEVVECPEWGATAVGCKRAASRKQKRDQFSAATGTASLPRALRQSSRAHSHPRNSQGRGRDDGSRCVMLDRNATAGFTLRMTKTASW